MSYATFDYYRVFFMGTEITDDVTFEKASLEASAYIDQLTGGIACSEVNDAVKNATCAVAEVIVKQAHDDDATVSSESVGNHSRSYSKTSRNASERAQEKYRKAALYLARTGLLYRGLR